MTVAVTGARTSAEVTGARLGATYPTGGQLAWCRDSARAGRQVDPSRYSTLDTMPGISPVATVVPGRVLLAAATTMNAPPGPVETVEVCPATT
jgi:hypothetical protein